MELIIVESPTKARTLGRFLGPDYQIEASMGHVRDLPEKKLGIDVEHDFAPEYVVSEKKKEVVKSLQAKSKTARKIILATDPDREGEAIAWHIASLLSDEVKSQKSKAKSLERITFHEITEVAIKEALAHPGEVNMQLVDSQQARRILDRLVGYKLSPLLWRKVRKGLSAGRVQSVAVRLIVEREREILAFKPEEYWEISAKLRVKSEEGRESSDFDARLVKIDDKTAEIKTKEDVDRIVTELASSQFEVDQVEMKEVKRYPYPPYTTSTLQQAAANLFGWSAKRTMQIAQSLYEQGLITYHRTDSMNLAAQAVGAVRRFIVDQYGQKYLPETPKFYKTKSKVAQEAHEAIRSTGLTTGLGSDHDQKRLYELIWKRFVACQMSPAEYMTTSVDISAGLTPSGAEGSSYLFRANGNKQIFDGWRRLFQDKIKDKSSEIKEKNEENGEGNMELPELTVGEVLQLLGLIPSQHFTEPPPRFNEASLIKTLEEFGIGRPSTYAPIISTIQDRQYVEKVDKKFVPSNLGFAVNDFLMANFPAVFDYQFTAHMEDDLDAIANGEKQWVPVIREFYDPFSELLGKVAETAARVKVEVEETDEICPQDGGKLVVRIGRFGKFLACSNFPNCKFTKPFQKKIEMKCPKCQIGDVIIRRTRSKKTFYGCSRYPDCDFASWTKPKQATDYGLQSTAAKINTTEKNGV